jgi:hypothetical protein
VAYTRDETSPIPPPYPARALTIRRVANGWIVEPLRMGDHLVEAHVFNDPHDLGAHVRAWGERAQAEATPHEWTAPS